MIFDATNFHNRLVQAGLASTESIHGCSQQEIETIERENELRLPNIYREFLLAAGRGAGRFMNDCIAFYPAILTLDKNMHKLQLDFFSKQQPCFVFLNNDHSGYFCYFFRGEENDPPVYGWRGSDEPYQMTSSFSEFIEMMLEHYGA